MKTDICTSLACDKIDMGCSHCPECIHAFYRGRGKDKAGRLWRWEYRPQLGVYFVRKDGQCIKYQPRGGSPAWDLFYEWKKAKRL